jgi:hypothetical protein
LRVNRITRGCLSQNWLVNYKTPQVAERRQG